MTRFTRQLKKGNTMKEESLVVPEAASIVSRRGNYEISTPRGISRTLVRDVDFGSPKKKDGEPVFPKPILYKAGAEKIIRKPPPLLHFPEFARNMMLAKGAVAAVRPGPCFWPAAPVLMYSSRGDVSRHFARAAMRQEGQDERVERV